ncbi:uncharacterized protein LOC127830926 [Dreissena polymorpha]|uniref:Uncharacterized protein n=1 Tax=Dreissena polymorpha TaxID=45954 RepID=A0A9D4MKX2_DREPO|nr:uncharacterized protein LOC127830926 [Dreissena polymorpha]KAH3877879.1 hypothetical protein DPMN_001759 [Dreissena polymorpha]
MEDVHAMLRDHVSVLNQVFKDVRFPPYTNTQTKQDHVRIQFEIHSIVIYNDSWCGLTSSSICNSSLEYQQVLDSYSETVTYKRLTENSKATINYTDFENADANDYFLSDDYFNNRHGQYCLSVLFTARELYKTTDEGKIPVNGMSMTAELGNSNGVCKEHNFAFVNLYKDAENP